MAERPDQRPEGALIERARIRKNLSVRKIAPVAGISEARWRQLVSGYSTPTAGVMVAAKAPDLTLARMARAVGVTPDQLREVNRVEAAEVLEGLVEEPVGQKLNDETPTSDELRRIRDNTSLPSHIRRQAQAQLDLFAGLLEAVQVAQGEDDRRSG